jgi:hypothetical protein
MTHNQPSPLPLTLGSHRAYDWLTTEHSLQELVRLCPELVLDKYLAVTSIDSGPMIPNNAQKAAGWRCCGGIAYSPRIQSIDQLPKERGDEGFDEWYIFRGPVDLGETSRGNIFEGPFTPGRVAVFVNYYGFRLDDPAMRALVDLFWKQLERIQPESYIADGSDCLTFITDDKELFRSVGDALPKASTG